MCGLDIHVDSNIGKRLSSLTKALTTITGESDVADLSSVAEVDDMSDAFEPEHEGVRNNSFEGYSYSRRASQDATDGAPMSPKRLRANVDFATLDHQLREQTTKLNNMR